MSTGDEPNFSSDRSDTASLDDSSTMGRRTFLAGTVFAAVGLAVGRGTNAFATSSSRRDIAAFMRLSKTASGVADLSPALGRKYFEALEAEGVLKMKPSEFARLAGVTATAGPSTVAGLKASPAYRARGGKECLDAVAAAWWSGTVPIAGGGQRVVTFDDAVVWREVHQSTFCQGATGSWSKPGRAAR